MRKHQGFHAAAALVVILLAGCAGKTGDAASAPPPTDGACIEMDIPSRLAKFREDKAKLMAQSGDRGSEHEAVFAYASAPVDIDGAGMYTFRVGPLDAAFNFPNTPFTMAFPDNYPAGMTRSGEPKLTESANGDRYLEATYEASADVTPCRGLVLFIF